MDHVRGTLVPADGRSRPASSVPVSHPDERRSDSSDHRWLSVRTPIAHSGRRSVLGRQPQHGGGVAGGIHQEQVEEVVRSCPNGQEEDRALAVLRCEEYGGESEAHEGAAKGV